MFRDAHGGSRGRAAMRLDDSSSHPRDGEAGQTREDVLPAVAVGLVRRAMVSAELASSELMGPVSSVLVADAAWSALGAAGGDSPPMVVVPPDLAVLVEESVPSDAANENAGARYVTREEIESDLSRTVRAALGSAQDVERMHALETGPELLDELAGAWYRVHLARRFHNAAVTQARRVRRKTLVRELRLAAHAAMPATLEIDAPRLARLGRPGPTARQKWAEPASEGSPRARAA